jgi:hypothetical protein
MTMLQHEGTKDTKDHTTITQEIWVNSTPEYSEYGIEGHWCAVEQKVLPR